MSANSSMEVSRPVRPVHHRSAGPRPSTRSEPGVMAGRPGAPTISAMTEPALTPERPPALAVLVSGGLDSAVLLAESARERPSVFPLYVRFGLLWEEAELAH